MKPGRFLPSLLFLAAALVASAGERDPVVSSPRAPSLLAASVAAQGWEPDLRLTRNSAASQTSINFARSIAADERGRVHVAWADERDGNSEIYYQRSIDGGLSWGPAVRLTVDSAGSYNPSIATQGDRVHVTWWDTRSGAPQVYHKRSLDGGATWEADLQVTASPGGGAHPSLAVSGDRVHVVYVDGRDGQSEVYYTRSLDGGATWEAEVRLSALPWNSYTPTVAASGEDVYVAWTDTRDQMELDHFEEEYFRHSSDGGATWEAEVRLTSDPASSWAPSLAADGSDVWVAWFDDRGGDWEIYVKRSTDRGGTWSADRRLTFSAGASLRPSLARRGSALHIAFWDTRDGNEEIYWLTSPDRGATWGDPVRLTYDTSASLLPSVAAATSGVHVVWTEGRDGNSEIYYKRLPGDPVAVGNGRVAFTRDVAGLPQIFTVDASGCDELQLTSEGANEYPAWSKDGSKLAFATDRTGSWEIWVMDADGSNQTPFIGAVTPGADFVPDWSHDGTRVAFASTHEDLGHSEIWVINTDGSGATRLTFGPAGPYGSVHPSWSAADERIYYAHDAGDGPQIWGMFPDGQGQEQKTAGLGPGYPHANVPEFRRNSEKLVFWAGMEAQFGEVWSWDFADPAGPRRLTDTPDPLNSDNPAWSPDGTKILFDTNRSGTEVEIWVMDADGSGARPFISGTGQTSWQPVTAGGVAITTPNSVPVGATGIDASVPPVGGASYLWSLTGGTITSGQGTSVIRYSAGAPGTLMTLSVTITVAGCASPAGSILVQVDFLDVPPSHIFHDYIATLARNRITSGCGGANYCPDATITRAQMAVFLIRGIDNADHIPPPAVGVFDDVPAGSFAADYIEELYSLGITAGCAIDLLRYCPNDPVTRAQMAVFLLRSLLGAAYDPPDPTGIFADVPVGSFADDFIEDLSNRAITSGCGVDPLRYCPDDPNTRGQMAVFVVRTFELQ